jgi:hypothetical protein
MLILRWLELIVVRRKYVNKKADSNNGLVSSTASYIDFQWLDKSTCSKILSTQRENNLRIKVDLLDMLN